MKTSTQLTIGLGITGCAVLLITALRTDAPPSGTPEQKRRLAIAPSPVQRPLTVRPRPQVLRSEEGPLLPPPVIPAETPAVLPWPNAAFVGRPAEESMMSSWAARDPEGAGRWLNQNRNHPKFADMVRGYAIQIATIDPAAARRWAGELKGNGNRFALGGTLEQHIDAIEAMLKSPDAPQTGEPQKAPASLILADYFPVLVRQYPDESPVLEMRPSNPFV